MSSITSNRIPHFSRQADGASAGASTRKVSDVEAAAKEAKKERPSDAFPLLPGENLEAWAKRTFSARMKAAKKRTQEERADAPCPSGGKHDYQTDEEGDVVCSKCLDPIGTAKKPSTLARLKKDAAKKAAADAIKTLSSPEVQEAAADVVKFRADVQERVDLATEKHEAAKAAEQEPKMAKKIKPAAAAVKKPKAEAKPKKEPVDVIDGLLENGTDGTVTPFGHSPRAVIRWAAAAGYSVSEIARGMVGTGHKVSMPAINAESSRARKGTKGAELTKAQEKEFAKAAKA